MTEWLVHRDKPVKAECYSDHGKRVEKAIAELERASLRALLASLKGPYLMEVPR